MLPSLCQLQIHLPHFYRDRLAASKSCVSRPPPCPTISTTRHIHLSHPSYSIENWTVPRTVSESMFRALRSWMRDRRVILMENRKPVRATILRSDRRGRKSIEVRISCLTLRAVSLNRKNPRARINWGIAGAGSDSI